MRIHCNPTSKLKIKLLQTNSCKSVVGYEIQIYKRPNKLHIREFYSMNVDNNLLAPMVKKLTFSICTNFFTTETPILMI